MEALTDLSKTDLTHLGIPLALGELGLAHEEMAGPTVNVLASLAVDRERPTGYRSSVIAALGKVGATYTETAPQIVDTLVSLLSDESEEVRNGAMQALAFVRASQAQREGELTPLLASLADPLDNRGRLIAGRALFLVALQDPSQSAEIQNALEELSQHRSPHLRIAANQTLQMLSFANLTWLSINNTEQHEIPSRLHDWQSASFFGEEVNWAAGEALEHITQHSQPDSTRD
jgi:HEAT repeat protein